MKQKTPSFLSIQIKRNEKATLKELSKVASAIQKQFGLFIEKQSLKEKPKIIVEQLNFENELYLKLSCTSAEEGQAFLFEDNKDIHKEFVEYCNFLVAEVSENKQDDKKQDYKFTTTELNNFNEIIAFANQKEQIVVAFHRNKEKGGTEKVLETIIDVMGDDDPCGFESRGGAGGGGRSVSRGAISGVSKARKRELVVELPSERVAFKFQQITFGQKMEAKIQLDDDRVAGKLLNSRVVYIKLVPEIAKTLLRYNEIQKIEWQACTPVVSASIKLGGVETYKTDEKKKNAETSYNISEFEILEVLERDIKDKEPNLFTPKKEDMKKAIETSEGIRKKVGKKFKEQEEQVVDADEKISRTQKQYKND